MKTSFTPLSSHPTIASLLLSHHHFLQHQPSQSPRYRKQQQDKRMVQDPEKAEIEASRYSSQDPITPSITPQDEKSSTSKREERDSDSIHSHSSNNSIQAVPEEPPLQQTRSRSSSVRSKPLSVPRSKRRGLLARLTIIPEVEKPYDYKRSTKWLITLQVALAAAAAPMGSAILLRKSLALYIMPLY